MSNKAYAEIKRLAKLDDRSVRVWFRLYCERTFATHSQPDVMPKRLNDDTPPVYVPENNLPATPYEIGDVPGQPDITCTARVPVGELYPTNSGAA